MKTFALLLLCLFLPGCEKRAADPEIENFRAWLLSDDGQKELAGMFNADYLDLDKFVLCEKWVVKRAVDDFPPIPEEFRVRASVTPIDLPCVFFLREKRSDEGRAVVGNTGEGAPRIVPLVFNLTLSEFENLKEPVSLKGLSAFWDVL
ncbi:MAG: hypothetical protein AAF514_05770 [Verrucomicrobiota bacterium]